MEKDAGGMDGQNKEAEKESKDKGSETSDEDEVINYPNQPPIQNGFVVFIHQLNLSTNAKEKRTVVEWISDALKLLDIHPETITVDKLMEESIATCTKAKVPVIKFSRPTGPNKTKQHEEQESTAPSFRFRSRKQEEGHSIRSEFISDHGTSKAPNNVNNNSSRPVAKVIQSKKKVFEKSKSGSISYGISGQSSMNPTWKSAKIVPQKSVNSVTVKGAPKKPVPSLKPPPLQVTLDDKKQEYGVQLSILRQKCRTMQKENHNHVWVLLIESRRRCIVDMGKLNSLATSFRFKVRWIAAQAPRSLDQSVFWVVNDIVQTKNISFPEQIKALRNKGKESKADGGKFSGRSTVTSTNNKAGISKSLPVEVLHKTLSAQFDVLSLASFDMTQMMKVVTNHHQPIKSLPPSSDQTTKSDDNDTIKSEDGKEGAAKSIFNKKVGNNRKYNKQNNDSPTNDSYESLTTTKTNSNPSLDQSTLSQ